MHTLYLCGVRADCSLAVCIHDRASTTGRMVCTATRGTWWSTPGTLSTFVSSTSTRRLERKATCSTTYTSFIDLVLFLSISLLWPHVVIRDCNHGIPGSRIPNPGWFSNHEIPGLNRAQFRDFGIIKKYLLNYDRPAHQMRTLYFAAVVSSSFFFFPRLFSAVADWMSTILPHMMRP